MRTLLVEVEPSAARMMAKGLREADVLLRRHDGLSVWRRKLDDPGGASLISTGRGEGYALFSTPHTHQQS